MKIVFQLSHGGSGIYTVNEDETQLTRLSPIPGFDATPRLVAHWERIIYTRVLDEFQSNVMPRAEIRLMNSDGINDHVILSDGTFSVEPRLSINDKVIFMSYRSRFYERRNYEHRTDPI